METQSGRTCVIGVIPVRYGSTRFPGKPLASLRNSTLLQSTYENAQRCKMLKQIIIATDDTRIYDHAQTFGAHVVMTSPDCPTGTDRIVDALKTVGDIDPKTIIVNIQGDEPCLEPEVIDSVVNALAEAPDAVVSTAVTKLHPEEAQSPSIVKCVKDQKGYALYFSRSLLPGNKSGQYNPTHSYYKHLGIYCYRLNFLFHYATLPPTPLQQAEDLEQLKILEHGFRIKTHTVTSCSIGIDTPEDLEKLEQILCQQNTSSQQAASAHP